MPAQVQVHVAPDEIDGGYTAWVDGVPGCVSYGETRDEALESVVEALTGVLAVRLQDQVEAESSAGRDVIPLRLTPAPC